MIHEHLQRRAMVSPPVTTAVHLDEDALSAFIEGRLSDAESTPVVQHLVGCGFCRRITAQLVRLESEIGPAEASAPPQTETPEPGRIRSLLADLAARVVPQSEGDSVFAYHAPAEDFKQRKPEADGDTDDDKSEDEQAGEPKPEDSQQQ